MDFKNWKVKNKLITSIVVGSFMFLVMGVTAVTFIRSVNTQAQYIVKNNIPSLDTAKEINIARFDYAVQLYNHIISYDKNAKTELEGTMSENIKKIYETIDKYAKELVTSDEDNRMIKDIKQRMDNCINASQNVILLSREMKTQEAAKLMQENRPLFDDANKSILELVAYNQKNAEQRGKGLDDTYNFMLKFVNAFIAVGMILIILFNMYMLKSILNPLKDSTRRLEEVSKSMKGASGQLSASSQQIAGGASEEASSVEEVTSTMEESWAMIKQTTENSRQASSLASDSYEVAERGSNEMKEMMSSMEEIKKSSSNIANIIKVIDEIAFQTNILALNAAVEAARAGDSGKGFAVVAEEVRNLAQRSANAAKDTEAIIEKNIELSSHGTEAATRVNQALIDILSRVQKLNDITLEVSAANQEQSQGIQQISKALAQISSVTQQNAAASEENASSAEELNCQADELQVVVSQLLNMINGRTEERINLNNTKNKNHLPMKNNTIEYNNNTKHIELHKTHDYSENKNSTHNKHTKYEDILPLEDDNEF